jgi:adenylate cyclase
MQGSVVVRTFSIAMIVIAVLGVVSAIDLISARNVGLRIQRITSRYLEIYGGVARVNVYSTEEAYRTRQYITEKTLGLHDEGSDRDSTVARLKELDSKVRENLRDARSAAAEELDSSDPLIDHAKLARIAERLAQIDIDERTHLNRQLKVIQAMDREDMSTFRESFGDIIKWRARYDDYIDQTRWMAFEAAQDAGEQVANFQKRSAFISVGLLALAGAITIIVAWFLSRTMVRLKSAEQRA